MQTSTSGGRRETEVNELTVIPYGLLFKSRRVTTVTPEGNSASTERNSSAETKCANSRGSTVLPLGTVDLLFQEIG